MCFYVMLCCDDLSALNVFIMRRARRRRRRRHGPGAAAAAADDAERDNEESYETSASPSPSHTRTHMLQHYSSLLAELISFSTIAYSVAQINKDAVGVIVYDVIRFIGGDLA